MGGLRTYLRAPALLCALAGPLPAQADTDLPDNPLHFFATCAGRMSALMEHQWQVDGPASDITKVRRAALLDVLSALTPPGSEAQVMAWRVEAKAAHAAGDEKKCIEITSKALQDLQNSEKGGQ